MNKCDLCTTEVYQPPQNYDPQINKGTATIKDIQDVHKMCVCLSNNSIFRVTKEGNFKGYSRFNLPMQIYIALLNCWDKEHRLLVIEKVAYTCNYILNINTNEALIFDRDRLHLSLHNTSYSCSLKAEDRKVYSILGKRMMAKFPANANAPQKLKEKLGELRNLAHRMVHERCYLFVATIAKDGATKTDLIPNIKSNAQGQYLQATTVWTTQ